MKEEIIENLDNLLKNSNNFSEYAANYFEYLGNLFQRVDINALGAFVKELENASNSQSTVFFIGNGGSAATASHMAQDLNIAKRIHPEKQSFRALSLADNLSVTTAIGNDEGFENIFLTQLKIHYQPGDKLVAISASGNSPNILTAVEWFKEQGGVVIGFVGFDGGKLKEFADILIHVETPQGEYGPVEDIHMIVDHLVYTWLRHQAHLQKKELN